MGGYPGARKANVKARREGWGEGGGWERGGQEQEPGKGCISFTKMSPLKPSLALGIVGVPRYLWVCGPRLPV